MSEPSAPRPPPAPRQRPAPRQAPVAGPVGAWAALTAALVLLPAGDPRVALLGSELGEADNHLWMFWQAGQALAGRPGPWFDLPEGRAPPLMDPVHLPIWLMGALIDPVVGWNLLQAACLGLALLGGHRLGRAAGGDGAALPTMVALGSAPFLTGVFELGVTEAWSVGLLALHAALLLELARAPTAARTLGAGALLGLYALTGWYSALFGLVAELPLLLWARARGAKLRHLLPQGLVGLALVLPQLILTLQRGAHWAQRVRPPSPQAPPFREDWDRVFVQGADLLAFLKPSLDAQDPSTTVYLGLVLLALAGAGLVLRGRQARPPLLVALPLCLLALGHWPRLAGHALGPWGPAAWLADRVELLQGVSHWQRAVGPALPFLALAATTGLLALPLGPRLRAGVLLLLLADARALAPTAFPRRAYPVQAPASLLALREESPGQGIIQLPFDNGRPMFAATPARLYDRWQVRHGLPRSEDYEGPDDLLRDSALVAGWQAATGQVPTLPPEQLPPRARRAQPPLTEPAEVQAGLRELRARGYALVVLHRARCPEPDRAQAAVEAALGPAREVGEDRVWRLDAPTLKAPRPEP